MSQNRKSYPVTRKIIGDGYTITNEGKIYGKRGKELLQSKSINSLSNSVSIMINGKSKRRVVHKLVAEAFIPNPNNYNYVIHIDEDYLNNNVENLKWISDSEQTKVISKILFKKRTDLTHKKDDIE